MRRFLRTPARARDPLPVTMTAVRMGERVLQIGSGDPALCAVLAAKSGLSGDALLAVPDETGAERARHACAAIGAHADVIVTPLDHLPLDAAHVDVVIVHGVDNLLGTLDAAVVAGMMRECRRVLRTGGRLIVIEAGERTGLAALLRRTPMASGQPDRAVKALQAAGFHAARLLADREGLRFSEGLKSE